MATDAAIDAAPAIINPIPRGKFAPEKQSTAPMASKVIPSAIIKADNVFFVLSFTAFQFKATAVPSIAAPASISPMPRGMFAPDKHKIAPMARAKRPSTESTFVSAALRRSDIAFQFSLISVTSPIAPAAISAIPRGIFAPEKQRIAPSAKREPQRYAVISSIFALYASLLNCSNTGDKRSARADAAPPPLELDRVLISSKLARFACASFAAAPTFSTAFASL